MALLNYSWLIKVFVSLFSHKIIISPRYKPLTLEDVTLRQRKKSSLKRSAILHRVVKEAYHNVHIIVFER